MPVYRYLTLGDIVVYEGLEYEIVDVNGSRFTLLGHNHLGRRSVLAWQLVDDIELVGRVPVKLPPELDLEDAGVAGTDAKTARVWHDVVMLLETGRDARSHSDERINPDFAPSLTMAVRVSNARKYLLERGIVATDRTVYNMRARYAADPSVLSFVDRRKSKRGETLDSANKLFIGKMRDVVEQHRHAHDISDKHLLHEIRDIVIAEDPDFVFTHYSTQSKYLRMVKDELHWGDSARRRKSGSKRPQGGHGVIRASRPGEFVHADTTKLAVQLLDEASEPTRYELSVLVDVYSTAVLGFALAPTTTAATIVRLLARASFPRSMRPFAGAVPDLAEDERQRRTDPGAPSDNWELESEIAPFVAIETLVVDNGKPYVAELTVRVAEQMGCSMRYSRNYSPEDKGKVEKALKDIETRLAQLMPGFVGASVEHRGDTTDEAILPHVIMVQLLSDWFDDVWANTSSRGLTDPFAKKPHLTPNQVLITATAIAPSVPVPDVAENYVRHLESDFRTIQHYGIDHASLVFDSDELSPLYGQPSGDRQHDNKFLVKWDPDYPTVLWVFDPFKRAWLVCPWKRLSDYERPFAREMLRGASTRSEGVVHDEVRATKNLVAAYAPYRLAASEPRSKKKGKSGRSAKNATQKPAAGRPRRRSPMTTGADDVRLMGHDEEIGL